MKQMTAKGLLLAGDHSHDSAHAFAGVGGTLDEIGTVAECTTDYAGLGASMLAERDLLVIHRDGYKSRDDHQGERVAWMQPA